MKHSIVKRDGSTLLTLFFVLNGSRRLIITQLKIRTKINCNTCMYDFLKDLLALLEPAKCEHPRRFQLNRGRGRYDIGTRGPVGLIFALTLNTQSFVFKCSTVGVKCAEHMAKLSFNWLFSPHAKQSPVKKNPLHAFLTSDKPFVFQLVIVSTCNTKSRQKSVACFLS